MFQACTSWISNRRIHGLSARVRRSGWPGRDRRPLAGSSYGDQERCDEREPISLLQIHGTDDMQIPYARHAREYADGFPGAVELIDRWAGRAGCRDAPAGVLPHHRPGAHH